jgi:hypothetical protein
MQVRREYLPRNGYGQGLAAVGVAAALPRIFLNLSREKNRLARLVRSLNFPVFTRMKSLFLAVTPLILFAVAAGAAPRPTHPVAKAIAVEKRFEGKGRVLLFQGQPCSPQIMFDLRQSFPKSTIRLAAPIRESRVLTDAARHRRMVHITGIWRHGRDKLCRFVDVARAILD